MFYIFRSSVGRRIHFEGFPSREFLHNPSHSSNARRRSNEEEGGKGTEGSEGDKSRRKEKKEEGRERCKSRRVGTQEVSKRTNQNDTHNGGGTKVKVIPLERETLYCTKRRIARRKSYSVGE